MGLLSDNWRKRAAELEAALVPIMQSPAVQPAVIQAVKAAVLPELLSSMADMLDVMEAVPELNAKVDATRARMERNHVIRRAAATGDWNAIDRIIDDAIAAAK
jgi:hypothetical protein